MGEWISVGENFIEADVIRWNEPIYHKRRYGKRRSIIAGHRQITAQVLHEEPDGWVYLEIRAYTILDITPGRTVPFLSIGEEIKRNRKTIARGEAERLEWSDESARNMVCSTFLGRIEADEKPIIHPAPTAASHSSQIKRDHHHKPQGPRLTP